MEKKTPSKPTKSTEDVTSPELPITTFFPQQRADSPSKNTREIQETPARPRAAASTTTSAKQHRSQDPYQENDIDDGDVADNEHTTKGDPSLNRSFGRKMKFSSHDEKAKRTGKIDSEMGKTDDVEENEQKVREKTPEDKELPEEVPETPQPERKRQKMSDD